MGVDDEIIRQPGESQLSYGKRRAAYLGIKGWNDVPVVVPTWDADLIPDVPKSVSPEIAQERIEIDAVLDKIDIVEAYNRWCRKMICDPGGKRESIMVSCPNPAHPDTHPSSWITLDKGDGGVGYCDPCSTGYDKYDIAAWHFGFDVPGYKSTDFPMLRRKMAEDLGYTVMVSGKDEWLRIECPQPLQTTVASIGVSVTDERVDDGATSPDTTDATVVELFPDMVDVPIFDWRTLPLEADTFLDKWLKLTSESYEPEEFYLWQGLMALAAACGNRVTYQDMVPVRPNLMVCLIGSTGCGKSLAMGIFDQLIRTAIPWDAANAGGVRLVSSPGSGEALLDQFQHKTTDPITKQVEFFPVNGMYREGELAAFLKRTNRVGNTMREIVMELYDSNHPVSIVSRSAGTVTAADHFMQMLTSTQPASIQKLLTTADASAGFLNRWVYGFGAAKIRPPRKNVPINVGRCVDSLRDVKAWSSLGREVVFIDGSPAAELWDEFYLAKIQPLSMNDDNWLAARLPLLAKKLMLLFAINDKSDIIQETHVQSLIAMWSYLLRSYGLVDESIGMNDLENCAKKIEKYFVTHQDKEITFRILRTQSGARKFDGQTILHALENLIKLAVIKEVPRPKSDQVIRYKYLSADVPPLRPPLSIVPKI